MVDYCTAADVLDQIGASAWPSTGPITQAKVEAWIVDAEDDINERTQDSWKSVTVTDEYHDFVGALYKRQVGVPIYMNHENTFTLATGSGDKLEVWDGSSWVDWLTDANYTEGRENDYWQDARNGIVYLKKSAYQDVPQGVRLTYRYGNQTVPGDIQQACVFLVAARVLEMDDTFALTVSQDNGIPSPDARIEKWRAWAYKKIQERARIRSITPSISGY